MLLRKIIIISENQDSLAGLSSILTRIGYDLVMADDNHSIVDIVIQEKPYAILLELEFMSKEGFELIDVINQKGPAESIPIIALVGLFKSEFKPLLRSYGINCHLKKTFQPLDVIWAMENLEEDGSLLNKERVLEDAIV